MPSEDEFDYRKAEGMVAESAAIIEQAQQVGLYYSNLKDQGLCEYEALELTKEWMQACFDTGDDE